MNSIRLSLWRRIVLLAGVVVVVTAGSLLGYRYYTRPVTLTIAVGSIDGEAAKAMSAIASRLALTNAPVRLNVVDSGTALGAAKAFSDGKADLAVVRGGQEDDTMSIGFTRRSGIDSGLSAICPIYPC